MRNRCRYGRQWLKQAQIGLAKTQIHAPFDCRLADVAIEPGQFVGADQALFKAHGIGATQINARFRKGFERFFDWVRTRVLGRVIRVLLTFRYLVVKKIRWYKKNSHPYIYVLNVFI